MAKIQIKQDDINKRLDVFLAQILDKKRNAISKAINSGIFKINGIIPKVSYKLRSADIIEYEEKDFIDFFEEVFELEPYDFKLDIKYEDNYLIIINKPKDLLTHPTKHEKLKTLSNALLKHCGRDNLSDMGGLDRLGIVHRLDKDTSGLIIAAKNNEIHENLSEQIKTKTLKRKYLALAIGEFREKSGTIEKPLLHYMKDDVKMIIAPDDKGLKAITNYKVVEEYRGISLVELELKTGRTHQIRVHLSSMGHPVLGDELYGAKGYMSGVFGQLKNLKTKGQLLQSYYISFFHPILKKEMSFMLREEEFSSDFIKALNILRRDYV